MRTSVRAGRRSFLAGAAAVAFAGDASRAWGAARAAPMFDLHKRVAEPVIVRKVELLRVEDKHFVRATSEDGSTGFAVTNQHASYLGPMFRERVASFFAGKDARDLEAIVDGVHVHQSNYKIVGVPFWSCVSWAELALLDLLGKRAGLSVGALLGGKPLRARVPMYLSSTDRGTSPEEEVARFETALAATGARAVKFKVGGRMSGNLDASVGRTETLIALMRKRLGPKITLYADANGSFDAKKGIEIGRLLEAHGVEIYEKPCPFEDDEATLSVTRALRRITVAGGEQDHSAYRFRSLIARRVLDMVQPDLCYNGGFVRTVRVARLAAAAGLPISPHCPQASTMLYTLHLCAFTPNIGPFQEIHVDRARETPWFAPGLRLTDGALVIPTSPGLGPTIDPAMVARAVPV